MPPTDDQDHREPNQQTLDMDDSYVPGINVTSRSPPDTPSWNSMESRAIRSQIDRLRTLQQKNDVLSGDKPLSNRQESAKPNSVKNYHKWLRAVAEGEATSVRSSSPPPVPRPRSRSLQLDAGDLTMFSRPSADAERDDTATSSDNSSRHAKSTPKPIHRPLKKDLGSDEESMSNCASLSSSPQQHKLLSSSPQQHKSHIGHAQKKSYNSKRDITSGVPHSARTTNSAYNKQHTTAFSNNFKRGLVSKPRPGTSTRQALLPIRKSRSKSLDTDGAKFVSEAEEASAVQHATPILPEIPSIDNDSHSGSNSRTCSSTESLSMEPEPKVPVSILKKSNTKDSFFEKTKSPYAVHVKFDDSATLIPSGCRSGRRATIAGSIAEDISFVRDNLETNDFGKIHGRRFSPPPMNRTSNDKAPWLAPGVFPGIRRNSLPPLSVTMSEIQAVGDDEDDDLLFNSSRPSPDKHMKLEITDFQGNDLDEQSMARVGLYDNAKSDSEDDVSDTSETRKDLSQPQNSCFSVEKKQDADSDDDIKCHVVHSFTPRPKLKNNVLSANGMFCGP